MSRRRNKMGEVSVGAKSRHQGYINDEKGRGKEKKRVARQHRKMKLRKAFFWVGERGEREVFRQVKKRRYNGEREKGLGRNSN
jgi:hypothetical protein